MFSTNFGKICCSFAQNKFFEKSKMVAVRWPCNMEYENDCAVVIEPVYRGDRIPWSFPIYWLFGYVPLERVWFSSHLVWYRV